jgi:hypothetical protein
VPVGVMRRVVGRICLRSSLPAWARANSLLTGSQRAIDLAGRGRGSGWVYTTGNSLSIALLYGVTYRSLSFSSRLDIP